MWVHHALQIILLIFTSTHMVTCFGKGSLTYVIDTTPSMTAEIEQVKQSTNSITQVVFDEKSSQIQNMVLVTFSDPNADLKIVTSNRNTFKSYIDQVFIKWPNVYDCPEMSMAGTLLALDNSLQGSYIYVFTDASAKDHQKSTQVVKKCQEKQSQIVFILTGDCNDYDTHPYQIYYDIAAACSGLTFYIRKEEVFSIFEPIKDAIKGKKEVITSRTIPAHTTKDISFEINDQTEYASVTASGKGVTLVVRGTTHTGFRQDRLTWLNNVKMLRLSQLLPGTYIATVQSSSLTTINIFSRTDFGFEYGFSGLDANSLKDTLPQPIAGTTTHLYVSVTDPNHTTNITSALILDMNENVMPNYNLPLRRIRDNYYVTPPFLAPSTNFKIAVFGKAVNTGKEVRRLARFPITPQPPEKIPIPQISGKPSETVKIGGTVDIKCTTTNSGPAPKISWQFMAEGKSKYEPISGSSNVLHISTVRKEDAGRYKCIASNVAGISEHETTLVVEYKPSIPSDNSKIYEAREGDKTLRIPCDAAGVPKTEISWSVNGQKITNGAHYSITDGALIISNPKTTDTNMYKCEAKNYLGSAQADFNVQIKGAPQINSTGTPLFEGSDKDAVLRIPCEAIGIPPPIISWSVNGEKISPGPHYSIKDGVLEIKNPKMVDSATYRCEATNHLGSTHADFDVKIKGIPYINSNDTKPIEGLDKDLTLRIPCNAVGVPPPTITWSINGKTITTGPHYTISPDGALVIKNPKMVDSGSYKCKATNSLGSGTSDFEVAVKGVPHIDSNDTATYEGSDGDAELRIPCDAFGVPPPTVTWSINGKTIRSGPHYSIKNGALIIKPAKMIDSGTYRCEATNSMGSTHADFNVKIKGIPFIDSNDTKTIEGSDGDSTLRIPCNSVGVPPPTITWLINGKPIRTGPHYTISSDGALVIRNPKMVDSGSYTCKATNSLGSGTSDFEVAIKGVPTINSNDSAVFEGSEKDIILRIPCEAFGIPPPKISWSVNGKTIRPGPHYAISGSELIIKIPKMIDSGTYRCEAKNPVGSAQADFKVKINGVPYIKSNDSKSFEGSDGDSTLRVPCNAVGVPPPVITWSINGKAIRSDSHYSILSDGTLVIKDPKMVDSGLYKCKATNNFGSGDSEFNVTIKAPPHIDPNSTKTIDGLQGDLALRIPCEALGIPPPKISWTLNGKPITSGRHYGISGNVLIIKDPKLADSGSYKCKATNDLGSTTAVLNVTVGDHLDDYGDTEDIKINKKVNSWYRLECGMPGQKVRWYMEGNDLNVEGNYLTLNDLDAAYNGNYTCRVSDMQEAYTKTFHLVIDGPPKFEFEQEDPVFDWTGSDDDVLNCNIESTNNVKVDWTYNGKVLSDHNSLMLSVGGRWGKYTCNVSNDFGSVQRTFEVISSRCLVPKDQKNIGSVPIILNEQFKWPTNSNTDYITFEQNEKILVYCPNYKRERNNLKKFPRLNELPAICDKQDTFMVNGKPYKIFDLGCDHHLTPTIQVDDKRCGTGPTKSITVGYQIGVPNFLQTYEVCFDTAKNMPQYSLEVMPNNYQSRDVHYNWYKHPEVNYPTSNNLYTCKDSSSICCYGKSQLVPARDFTDGPAQNTTFIESINAIPLWRPCSKTETTWQVVEENIRMQLDLLPASVIWSGTHTFQKRNGHLVPRYLFKLVEFIEGSPVAIIYINGPSPTKSDVLCKNICADDVVMLLYDLGEHVYCCNGYDFREAFNFNAHKNVNFNL